MGAIVAELVDTGEKRDTRGRRLEARERKEELLGLYRESGLTMAAFARREKLSYSTFAGWVLRHQRRSGRRRSKVRFTEVRLGAAVAPAAAPVLEVRLADGTTVRGTVAMEVAALVRGLRS
jgi:transposase-like protein